MLESHFEIARATPDGPEGRPYNRLMVRPRTILGVTFVAALVVFAVVQDRVTASGARQYVALQRSALAGGRAPIAIEEVMAPATRRSMRDAVAWSGGVMLVGVLGSRFWVPRTGEPRE